MSRLKKLESLFHQALELEDELRLEFLKRECGNDKGLLDELCALLESDSSNDNFMEEPAMAVHAGELSMISPHITEGSVIGRHRLLSPIGIGGMGSVYQACDTRSGRIEAVKILAPDLASTRSAIRRFFREAKRVLADDGYLCIGIPDASRYDKMYFFDFFWFLIREHIQHFDIEHLKLLAG